MIATLLKTIATVLIFPTVFLLHGAGYQLDKTIPPAVQALGAFNTTGGGTYNLQSTITSNQTTITLSTFEEPQSNIPYTMSYLNSTIEYATIAPQTSQSEFISFTGITQNTDGSATLTGVQRGLDRSYPYTASTTLALPHAGQSRFILSNPPQVYNSYAALANNNTYEGSNTFSSTSPAFYDADPIWANFSTQIFADVSYVNSVVAAGAANASESVKGIIQLATAAQAAAGTSLGSTGARLALGNNLASSTPTFQGTQVVPVTGTNEKISQLFLDLTQAFNVSGLWTFTNANSFIAQGSSTVSGNLNVGSFTIGGVTPRFDNFGGTGSDGALTCTSGTTQINLGGNTIVVKNYTSISITGTCYVELVNGNVQGTETILKSQGNVTLTSSAAPMLDASSTGAIGGAGCFQSANVGCNGSAANNSNVFSSITGSTGGGGGVGGNSPSDGSAGTKPTAFIYYPFTNVSQTPYQNVFVGSGGGGSGCSGNNPTTCTGGSGANGGGALIVEVGGALNFTTANGISVAGQSATSSNSVTSGVGATAAGGSGGGAGFFEMLYNTLTANSGTVNVAGGAGTPVVGAGDTPGAGGSGGNPINAGASGALNGLTGGAGYSLVGQNPR